MSTPTIGKLVVEKLSVTERAADWLVRWESGTDAGRVRAVPTAAEAQRRIGRYGRVLTRAGISSALVIAWQPTTAVGRAVLRALGIDKREVKS